ncbi:MAG: hypothetical protein AB1505_29190 [Candidatus Latescibacterota bacterium]
MTSIRQLPTEAELLEVLRKGLVLAPVKFRLLERAPRDRLGPRLDGLVEAAWDRRRVTFAAEVKALSTPKALQTAIGVLRAGPLPRGALPLVVLPFLRPEGLEQLERLGISGIDLCGNGVVVVPGQLTVVRSGQPNRFASGQPIKNIYRRRSSLVGRTFLSRPVFSSVREVVDEVASRMRAGGADGGRPLTFGTVSKVLAGLEEDLLVSRRPGVIRLLQPDTLLDRLTANYAPPAEGGTAMKVDGDRPTLLQRLADAEQTVQAPIVATGLSSVWRYATMQRGDVLSVYCPRAEGLAALLPGVGGHRFPNLEILQTADDTAYFDAVEEQGFRWAGPVQAYLELAHGDKRDQEVAAQVRARLLSPLNTEEP